MYNPKKGTVYPYNTGKPGRYVAHGFLEYSQEPKPSKYTSAGAILASVVYTIIVLIIIWVLAMLGSTGLM